jgi:hypothetical protein
MRRLPRAAGHVALILVAFDSSSTSLWLAMLASISKDRNA